jgi:hypothetical protein
MPRGDLQGRKVNVIGWQDEHVCGEEFEEECNNEFVLAWTRY